MCQVFCFFLRVWGKLQISRLSVGVLHLFGDFWINSRIDPVVDPQLPREQAGFRRGRSTVDQVTLLKQDIEDSFQNNEKAG